MEWILMSVIIPFAIGLVIGAFIGLIIIRTIYLILEVYRRTKPRNHVHFYVARDKNSSMYLYLSKPVRCNSFCFYPRSCCGIIASEQHFEDFNLKVEDFKDLKWEDEPVEVFINIDD